jgi:hypothetical protein
MAQALVWMQIATQLLEFINLFIYGQGQPTLHCTVGPSGVWK